MIETQNTKTQNLDNSLLIEALGTLGLALATLPALSLMLSYRWIQPDGRIPLLEAARSVALGSLVLPAVAVLGCLACLTSLALMQSRWLSGWERAVLGLVVSGIVLGYWVALLAVGVR